MFVARVAAIGERFLSARSFTLIVAPAIADFEFDGRRGARASGYVAVLLALAGAAWEDIIRDTASTFTFLAVALLPACYYTFLFILCLPPLHGIAVTQTLVVLGVTILGLSTTTAVVCYWPDPLPDRAPSETGH
jgi:hypothetical protein